MYYPSNVGLRMAQFLSNRPLGPTCRDTVRPARQQSQIKSLRVRSKKREQNAPAEWGTLPIGTQPTHPIRVPMLPRYPQIRGQQTALPEDSLESKTCESGRSILSPSLAATYTESLSSSHVDDNSRPARKGFFFLYRCCTVCKYYGYYW